MKTINVIIVLLSLILLAGTCKKEENMNCHFKITFYNYSASDIYTMDIRTLPDTIITSYYCRQMLDLPIAYKVKQGTSSINALTATKRPNTCWEKLFNTEIDNFRGGTKFFDTLMIYVFDAEVLENIPLDTIEKYQMYQKRYDLSLEDLQRMNWTIIYDGK